jgi:aminopeptidase N
MMAGTHEVGDFTYGFITYVRPIVAFSLLFDYMGKDKFYQAIRLFAENWKGKHPIPYDLFHSFNKVAEEDLGWFWKPWFFELGYADIGVGEVEFHAENAIINIENLGSFPIPINLLIKFKDGTEMVVKKKMDVWKSDAKSCLIKINRCDIKEIILNQDTPEAFYGNNIKKI